MNEQMILVQPKSKKEEVCYYRCVLFLFCTAAIIITTVNNLCIVLQVGISSFLVLRVFI